MEIKNRYIIGIDPDIDKSGYAVLDVLEKKFVRVEALSFSKLIITLSSLVWNGLTSECLVIIEDSDNSTNWHLGDMKMSARAAAAIGHNVGLCHATQRHIKEWAENIRLRVELQKPLKKTWLGSKGKISQEEAECFMPGLPKKTNTEMRDAALLAWCRANLPIHIPASFYTELMKKKKK